MTDKELRKLTRTELLELLLVQTRELDRLNTEIESLRHQLQNKEIKLSQAGNIATAALQLNCVFEAAQAAADQYLENIMAPVNDTQSQCQQMLEETKAHCDQMLLSTQKASRQIWEIIRSEMFNPKLDYAQWKKISDYIDTQLKQE